MAAKNKTCRKRQCKRGTVKWRGGGDPEKTVWEVPKTDKYYRTEGLFNLPNKINQENPLKSSTRESSTPAAPRQTTSTPAAQQTTSIPAAPRTPAAQQTTRRRSLEEKPAAQRQTTSKRISLAQPNTKTPNLASTQTSSQQPGKNKPTGTTEKGVVKDFDYREKIFSDIKKYADFRELEKKKVSFENALTDGAIDMDTPEAKLFNDYIKSRYDYFSYLNKKPSFLKLNRNRSKYYWELGKYEWTLRKLKNKYDKLDKEVRVKDILPYFGFIPTKEERANIYRYNDYIIALEKFKKNIDYYIYHPHHIPDIIPEEIRKKYIQGETI